MYLVLYHRLSTRSRRAIQRKFTDYGNPYFYRPRGNLLKRLALETGMTVDQVYEQLQKERQHLISTNK